MSISRVERDRKLRRYMRIGIRYHIPIEDEYEYPILDGFIIKKCNLDSICERNNKRCFYKANRKLPIEKEKMKKEGYEEKIK